MNTDRARLRSGVRIVAVAICNIKRTRGGRRKLPLVFTEHGAIMSANVLNSKTAVAASVEVVRAFIRLRQMLASNTEPLLGPAFVLRSCSSLSYPRISALICG
jgi:hypothetical protein